MNRETAIEIHALLLNVVESFNRAEFAIGELDRDDRAAFATALGGVSDALHWELLPVIYKKYPDLRPPDRELSPIINELRWEEVSLPASVSVYEIDRIIFSFIKPLWLKTAMVVGSAFTRSQEIGLSISAEIIAARIQALAEAGRIENQGDIRKWRHSEVRLKP